MDLIARRFRGILIAVIVLGLSAGAVFAGQVALQVSTAGQSAEQTDQNGQGADENDNEAPDADEDADANEQETPEAPDADEQNGEDTAAGNHGALVSAAAHMATPDGFKNHGAFVSCVAHIKDIPAGMTVAQVLAAVTPATCAAAQAALPRDERDELNAQDTAAGNHGALVSRAAQMPTPAGFANHGAFVSCVAHMKDVADPATFDFSLVTPDTCAAAAAARAADKAAKVHGQSGLKHGKGRGHSGS